MEPQFQPPLLTEEAKTTPFLVVRSLKNEDGSAKGHSLQIGDVIKLGRMEYLVLEYRDKRKTYSLGPSTLIDPEDIMEVSKSQRAEQKTCRVCFCDQETQQNFLVSPCLCKGSCLFVHINCLRRWITSKIKRQIGALSSMYNFSKLECQICKRAFPHALKRNNKSMPMVSIQKPNKPYIILQSLNESRVGQKVLFLNCVNQANNTIRLGRSQTSQIRISDISVSRNHATIKFQKKKFKLYDSSSKFGTLVRIRESICFGFDLLALQIGRTVILFSMRNKGMSSCTDDQPEQP